MSSFNLSDSSADRTTTELFNTLKSIAGNKMVFGQQQNTEYKAIENADALSSDIFLAIGRYPALYGWDLMHIEDGANTIYAKKLRSLIIEAFQRGAINTLSWHMSNPVTEGKYDDTTVAVKHILPGGRLFNKYLRKLDNAAEFLKSLSADGTLVPLIFRPFHEFDGNWFWWGSKYCSIPEFIALWQLTVDYLRIEHDLHNLLYAYSIDKNFINEDELLFKYPGNRYVDIIGMDNYHDFKLGGGGVPLIKHKLKILTKTAESMGKIAAFTETGIEKIPFRQWWTGKLLKAVTDPDIRISYIMIWRNAGIEHYYIPFNGDKSSEDFKLFSSDSRILFEDNLGHIYKPKIKN